MPYKSAKIPWMATVCGRVARVWGFECRGLVSWASGFFGDRKNKKKTGLCLCCASFLALLFLGPSGWCFLDRSKPALPFGKSARVEAQTRKLWGPQMEPTASQSGLGGLFGTLMSRSPQRVKPEAGPQPGEWPRACCGDTFAPCLATACFPLWTWET